LQEAHYTLGVIYWQQGKLDEAVTTFRQAIAVNPNFAEAHYTLGTVLQQKGETESAISEFREAIKLAPKNPEIRNTLGNALRAKGDIAAARVEFAEGARLQKLKSNNQAATFATNTGIQRLKDGAVDDAIEMFEKAIGLDPEYAPAHYQMGLALRKKGKQAEAQQAFNRARQLDPRLRLP
jgi:Tfp pilus assembly protein PilF